MSKFIRDKIILYISKNIIKLHIFKSYKLCKYLTNYTKLFHKYTYVFVNMAKIFDNIYIINT